MRIVFLSKINDWTNKAEIFLKQLFGQKNVIVYKSNEKYKKIPEEVKNEYGEILISFLSPWIVPEKTLKRFRLAINFHPGPPEYPGTGCYNFAIYEGAKEYGVTCHIMRAKVDSGEILRVIRFPLYETDTPESLQRRSLDYLLVLFYEIIDDIYNGRALNPIDEEWKRSPFSRKDLESLCKIDPLTMSKEEIMKRIKATIHSNPKFGPYVEVNGYKFFFIPNDS